MRLKTGKNILREVYFEKEKLVFSHLSFSFFRKQITSAPSCRHLLFVWDQASRAKSTCPFGTSYPWCTLITLSLMVWTTADSLLKGLAPGPEPEKCVCERASEVTAEKSDPREALEAEVKR